MTTSPIEPPARRRTALLLLPLGAVLSGVLAGGAVVTLTVLVVRMGSEPREGFTDLGIVVLGMLLGAALGVTAVVIVLALVARRLFERGRRLVPVLWSLAGVLGLFVVLSVVTGMLPDGGAGPSALTVTSLLAVLLPSVVFLLWDRRESRTAR